MENTVKLKGELLAESLDTRVRVRKAPYSLDERIILEDRIKATRWFNVEANTWFSLKELAEELGESTNKCRTPLTTWVKDGSLRSKVDSGSLSYSKSTLSNHLSTPWRTQTNSQIGITEENARKWRR